MANVPSPLASAGSGEMFDRIAVRYDLLNRIISLGLDSSWRRYAVRALDLHDGDSVLDLATGTADLALEVAKQNPSVHVRGLDPSSRMLEIGRQKVILRSLEHSVQFDLGDAQSLPYPDQSYDRICMAFGIRNVPDRPAALREMARVIRPGGRICLLELSEPESNWFGGLTRWYVHRVVPFLGAMLSGAFEYRYLARSIAAFPRANDFARVMQDSGLDVLQVKKLGFGACHLYVARPKELSR